jgi:hypothetical protein
MTAVELTVGRPPEAGHLQGRERQGGGEGG